MGFPIGYTALLYPKIILQIVFLLGYFRRFVSWALDKAGLGDLLDPDRHLPTEQQTCAYPEFTLVSSLLIEEILPVVRYEEISSEEEKCTVCLCEVEGADEVRRLSNCGHVFHRGCLDRWMDHDQSTCPLCRTSLVPEEMQEAFNDRIWAAAGLPDSFSSQELL